ncbi:MAG: hypothetical protein ACK4JF_10150 [Methylohalobius sp.]
MGTKQNILVINDEAHHAYRPAPLPEEVREGLSGEEIAEREEATVWVSGLDKIHAVRGINFCADFSATPFHIKGSGHFSPPLTGDSSPLAGSRGQGAPFPWMVSDFGLVDAIESGIVKIPRVPVDTVGKAGWEGEGDPPGKNSGQQTTCGEPLVGRLEQKMGMQ